MDHRILRQSQLQLGLQLGQGGQKIRWTIGIVFGTRRSEFRRWDGQLGLQLGQGGEKMGWTLEASKDLTKILNAEREGEI